MKNVNNHLKEGYVFTRASPYPVILKKEAMARGGMTYSGMAGKLIIPNQVFKSSWLSYLATSNRKTDNDSLSGV